MDEEKLLAEQLAYYNARAQEYDESVKQTGRFTGPGIPEVDAEWQYIARRLHALPPVQRVLELACGTGLWTQELLDVGEAITALDGAAEMLAANRAKLGSERVQYQQADLFAWQPDSTYDLVFFAFWISHVPPARLAAFLEQAAAAVAPGGRIFIADEPAGGSQLSGPSEGVEQTRTLHSGESYRIVKVYHDPAEISRVLEGLGFKDVEIWAGDYFFWLTAVRG